MKKKTIFSIFIFSLIIIFLYLFLRPSGTNIKFCLKDEDCLLSNCGCKCYTNGFQPKLECGVDCPVYNVTGCKCVNYRCVEIGTYTTPPLEYMND